MSRADLLFSVRKSGFWSLEASAIPLWLICSLSRRSS